MASISLFQARPHRRALLTSACAFLFFAGVANAAPNANDAPAPAAANNKTENCLLVNRIRKTKVVDSQTVLFYLAQNEIYKNVLPQKCTLLYRDDGIIFKPTGNQLCSVDTIGPIVTDAPTTSITRCGLGTFELIDKPTADKLISDAKAK